MLFPADCRIRRDSSFPELLCRAIFSSEVVKHQGVVEEYLICHSKLRGVKFYPLSVPEHLLKLSNYIPLTRIRVGAERGIPKRCLERSASADLHLCGIFLKHFMLTSWAEGVLPKAG